MNGLFLDAVWAEMKRDNTLAEFRNIDQNDLMCLVGLYVDDFLTRFHKNGTVRGMAQTILRVAYNALKQEPDYQFPRGVMVENDSK